MVRYKVIQPSSIRFTTDNISSHFDNGLNLNTVVDSVIKGSTNPESIGAIRVFNLKGIYHTCDNKRLYILRAAQSLGCLDYISVTVVSPGEIDLTVVKFGRDGKEITFDDGSEPYTHWIEEWGFPRVIDRQISNSSLRSQGSPKSSSEKDVIDWNHSSREKLIPNDEGQRFLCCACLTGADDDYDPNVQ